MRLIRAIASSLSFGVNPVRSSSNRSSLGDVAKALASWTRLNSITFKFLAGTENLFLSRPTKSRSSFALFNESWSSSVFLPKSAPRYTLSRAVMSGNDWTVWAVFVIPLAHIWCGGSFEMSSFRNSTVPVSALYIPLITFRSVDLPEPLGPTSPVISFSLTVKFTVFSALSPPNSFETSIHRSNSVVSRVEKEMLAM